MTSETEDQKQERLKRLMDGVNLTKSGYAGILPSGTIVDRREHPDAIPIQKNSMFGNPVPKKILKLRICENTNWAYPKDEMATKSKKVIHPENVQPKEGETWTGELIGDCFTVYHKINP